jgi:hypothetical protein
MIEIEKIRTDYNRSYKYRLSLKVGNGETLYQEVECADLDIADHPEQVKRKIKAGINELIIRFKDKAMHHLESIHRQTGDYDTGNQEPTERIYQRERALRRQQAAFQNASASSSSIAALPFGATLGNQYFDITGTRSINMPWPSESLRKKDKAKDAKAMKLLKSKIGRVKFLQLRKKGYFEEQGKHGTYRFHLDNPHGITCIKHIKFGRKERPLEWDLCIQSSVPDMPKGDIILSRWMEFKADENKFIKTANFRNVRTVDEATNDRWYATNRF